MSMGNAVFLGLTAPKPFDGFSKNGRLIMSATPPHMQILGSAGSKGTSLRMREVVAVRRLLFSPFYRAKLRVALYCQGKLSVRLSVCLRR